jgi:hypothetical protein
VYANTKRASEWEQRNTIAAGPSIYCIHIWRPCRKGTRRRGRKEEARAENIEATAKAKTDPTLSLLRQLWCAVDVFVVALSSSCPRVCNSFFFQSSFGSVTLMILNYCLMIYKKGPEREKRSPGCAGRFFFRVCWGGRQFEILCTKKGWKLFRIEHDTKVVDERDFRNTERNFTCADTLQDDWRHSQSFTSHTKFWRLFGFSRSSCDNFSLQSDFFLSDFSQKLQKNEISTSSTKHTRHYNDTPYIKLRRAF